MRNTIIIQIVKHCNENVLEQQFRYNLHTLYGEAANCPIDKKIYAVLKIQFLFFLCPLRVYLKSDKSAHLNIFTMRQNTQV